MSLCSTGTEVTVSPLCQHRDTGTDQLRDLSSRLKRGRPSAARPRVEAGTTSGTVATATPADSRWPELPESPGPAVPPAPSGRADPLPAAPPPRPASGTEGRERRAAAAGQWQGKGFTPQRVCPSNSFVLPSTSAEEKQAAAPGQAGPARPLSERRRGQSPQPGAPLRERGSRLSTAPPLPGSAGSTCGGTDRGTDPRGGRGAPPPSGGGAADPQLTPTRPPPPAGTCLPLPVPFPSSAPSSRCPPHAYGWTHAPAALG